MQIYAACDRWDLKSVEKHNTMVTLIEESIIIIYDYAVILIVVLCLSNHYSSALVRDTWSS